MPDDNEKRACMGRKAASEGKRTSVRLRLSGAKLHIRYSGMKPILQKQCSFSLTNKKISSEIPGDGKQKGHFDRYWREPSCKCATNEVQEVVEKEDTDRTIVGLRLLLMINCLKIKSFCTSTNSI